MESSAPQSTAAPLRLAPPEGPVPCYLVDQRDGSVQQGPTTLPPEELGPGDVLIAVAWSSVNYKDGMVTQPGNRVARKNPLVPGVDLSGWVVSSDDPALTPGRPVVVHGHDLGVAHHGGFASYARVPSAWVVPLPEGLDPRAAMIVGTAGFTAALSVDALERWGLTPGAGPVLVTGASGGVGSLAVAMLAARGYHVVASTGKVHERAWLEGLGAREVLGRDELEPNPGRVLGPGRFAGAVDCVGGRTLALVLRDLAYGGAVAASGLTGGAELQTTVYPFITRNVSLLGIDSVATPAARRQQIWQRIATPGDLRPADLERFVHREVTLGDLGGALAEVLQAQVRGRILVRTIPEPRTPG